MTKLEQLKQYISKHPPNKKKSKLEPYYDLIVETRQSGYSYREIAAMLLHIEVKAYPSEIKRFIDRKQLTESSSHQQKSFTSKSNHSDVTRFLDSEPKG